MPTATVAAANGITCEPAPVGSFAANAFGLYDMVGSIWEWVVDCYHPSYEVETSQGKVDAPTDGSEWTSACPADQRHVVRGGAWHNSPDNLRSAYRTNYTADDRSNGLGFRVARTLDR